MSRIKSFNDFTKRSLWNLRKQIVLCSIYIADYCNTYGFEPQDVCDFFDGYADFLEELMNEDGLDGNNQFFDHLNKYDNADNLWNWFLEYDDLSWVRKIA